jgi:hypothetical protein
MVHDSLMDKALEDIVDIFTNVEGVKLVRRSGLLIRESSIAGGIIDAPTIDTILHKMKMQNVINYKYVFQCPYCNEVIYRVDDQPSDQLYLCDTCQSAIIPKDHLYTNAILI